MAEVLERDPTVVAEATDQEKIAALLGGARTLGTPVRSALDVHLLLMNGLPGAALRHLLTSLISLHRPDALERATGMSLRTVQRRRETPDKRLNREQSGRLWKFAEVLKRAIDVFGSREDAEVWLEQPALGLEGQRPIDLLETPAGVELVQTHLNRLAYGVYT